MVPTPPSPTRRAIHWKWWIIFAALWLLLGGVLWGVDAAERRQEAIDAQENSARLFLIHYIEFRYASHDSIVDGNERTEAAEDSEYPMPNTQE